MNVYYSNHLIRQEKVRPGSATLVPRLYHFYVAPGSDFELKFCFSSGGFAPTFLPVPDTLCACISVTDTEHSAPLRRAYKFCIRPAANFRKSGERHRQRLHMKSLSF
jgi:hypothetical protein